MYCVQAIFLSVYWKTTEFPKCMKKCRKMQIIQYSHLWFKNCEKNVIQASRSILLAPEGDTRVIWSTVPLCSDL